MVATLPFTLISCSVILFFMLGLTFICGIAILLIAIYINMEISRASARYQKEYMKKQDARISMTTECLNNIKMLKLYSWTDIFYDLIMQKREEELGVLRKKLFYGVAVVTTLYFFPLMLQSVSFVVYIAFGHTISLSEAFVILTIL